MPAPASPAQFADLLPAFLKARAEFEREILAQREKGTFDFPRIDQMEIRLYHLKNATHLLGHPIRAAQGRTVKPEVLFDLLVGSVFHEMLHLKEFIYSITSYGPAYETLLKGRGPAGKGTIDSDLASLLRQILDEARRELPHKIDEIRALFHSATAQMEEILRASPEDVRLPRLLYSAEDDLDAIYGPQGLSSLFARVHPGGAAEGFFRVASSFLAGGFVVEAVGAFRRALDALPAPKAAAEEARRLVLPIRERLEEIRTRWPNTAGIEDALSEWNRQARPLLQGAPATRPAREPGERPSPPGPRRK